MLMMRNSLKKVKSFSKCQCILSNVFSVVKHEVVGVIGEGVAIPCNCTPSYAHTGDKPALILWYKDKAKLPIYRWLVIMMNGKLLVQGKFILTAKDVYLLIRKRCHNNLMKNSVKPYPRWLHLRKIYKLYWVATWMNECSFQPLFLKNLINL